MPWISLYFLLDYSAHLGLRLLRIKHPKTRLSRTWRHSPPLRSCLRVWSRPLFLLFHSPLTLRLHEYASDAYFQIKLFQQIMKWFDCFHCFPFQFWPTPIPGQPGPSQEWVTHELVHCVSRCVCVSGIFNGSRFYVSGWFLSTTQEEVLGLAAPATRKFPPQSLNWYLASTARDGNRKGFNDYNSDSSYTDCFNKSK